MICNLMRNYEDACKYRPLILLVFMYYSYVQTICYEVYSHPLCYCCVLWHMYCRRLRKWRRESFFRHYFISNSHVVEYVLWSVKLRLRVYHLIYIFEVHRLKFVYFTLMTRILIVLLFGWNILLLNLWFLFNNSKTGF